MKQLKINSKVFMAKILVLVLFITGCAKSTEGIDMQLAKDFLSNKIWYLDYTVNATNTKTYVGQSTYFISFGVCGIYSIV